ncbi:hypothetical protein BHE74_00053460 [Ensete ventricosum]|nr:hypothetical protein GW17_00001720 [Ensete ventricosum]RWW41075.1 hypothetical protein BHE74_00053460 [Ensete ventricosum]RZS15197.1 hypothetical protein BHM03_00047007 [Ensete ventricosum]
MLACIACSKHDPEDGGDDTAARAPTNPSSRDPVKSLTSQVLSLSLSLRNNVVLGWTKPFTAWERVAAKRTRPPDLCVRFYHYHKVHNPVPTHPPTEQDRHPRRLTQIILIQNKHLQLKDMVLKFSGTHRHCKGGGSSSSFGKSKTLHHHQFRDRSSYLDKDVVAASDAGSHYDFIRAAGSSSSTPAWDFSSYSNNNVGQYEEEGSSYGGKWIQQQVEEDAVAVEEEGEPKEWMAQVEPGVHITFVSLPGGAGNDLKRIRFSREMFNKWQAQRWWGENYDRIMELYNVQRFSRQAFPTPPRSDDGEPTGLPSTQNTQRNRRARDHGRTDIASNLLHGKNPTCSTTVVTTYHKNLSTLCFDLCLQRESSPPFYTRYSQSSPVNPPPTGKERLSKSTYGPPSTSGRRAYCPPVPDPSQHLLLPQYFYPAAFATAPAAVVKGECSSMDASRTTTSSRASVSISNASDLDVTEWVEQDEPGVRITIRELPDGTRELRRVRFR